MAKFKHGFPVSSAIMIGFLSKHSKVEKEELMRLATAMVLSEEIGQDINRMAQTFNANLELARSFELPEHVDAPTVWAWRFEGFQIIRDTAKWLIEDMQAQAQHIDSADRGRRSVFAFQTSVITEAFNKKIKKEQKLAEEVIKKGLTT